MPNAYNMNKAVGFRYSPNDLYSSSSTFGLRLESEIIGFPETAGILDTVPAFYGKPYEVTPVEYKRRRLVFNFGLMGVTWQWPAQLRELTEKIHGKKFRIEPNSVPGYHFIGRCQVSSYERALRIGKVQVVVDAEPYMVKNTATTISRTTDKLITFINASNFDTPADIVITSSSTSGTMNIYCDALPSPTSYSYIRIWQVNIELNGDPIHLDGIVKKIYQGGVGIQADVQKAFPYFKPGSNRLYIRPTSLSVSSTVITYNERSM